MSSIEIYAELLNNIHAVTLVIRLQTESNKETKASVSADGQTITVSHDGQSASIRLPTQMEGGGTATLTLPAAPSKDLTLRLQLEEKEPGLLKLNEDRGENVVPWSATELAGQYVQCRECGSSLIKDGVVREWRDLPNENWAEMMDFWHCHKPHDDDGHSHESGSHESVAQSKGYASTGNFQTTSGLGFVALSYLLLAEDDCQNLSARQSEESNQYKSTNLACAKCDNLVGSEDRISSGWRLFKWSIAIGNSGTTIAPSLQKWLSAQLISAIDTEGVRRFIVEQSASHAPKVDALLLWVFTDDMSFSSSIKSDERSDPTRAMKILSKPVADPEEVLQKSQYSLEHITIPQRLFQAVSRSLEDSREVLPLSSRTFQDWNVGLLERFRSVDVASHHA